MYCLFVRQPWAWLILRPDLHNERDRFSAKMVGEIKDIDNRGRPTNIRGEVLIGASKTCTQQEWEAAELFVRGFNPRLADLMPRPEDLDLGGIVGKVRITRCVTFPTSHWFCGPYGYVLTEQTPLPFVACQGQRGFFDVKYPIEGQNRPSGMTKENLLLGLGVLQNNGSAEDFARAMSGL